jgi:hypothetical protein
VSPRTHGLIPVWGFGTIVKSSHPKLQEGERVYGYLAPTRYLLLPVSSNDVNKFAFYVPRPHLPAGERATLSTINNQSTLLSDRRPYNQILRCANDPQYTPTPVVEDLTMLYRPLFWTSYWFEDWLHASGYRGGVSTVLISSASSKTAFCLAYVIGKRIRRGETDKNTKIIGLTSKRNLEFTKKLGLYDEVLEYGSFTSAPSFHGKRDNKWFYVDVAGNDTVNSAINAHFASPYTGRVVASVALGITTLSPSSTEAKSIDWGASAVDTTPIANEITPSSSPFPPKVESFFMPEWLDVRRHQIPVTEIFSRQNQAWKELMEDCPGWVQLERTYGAAAVQTAYRRLSSEGLGPDKGLIWSMWDAEPKDCLLSRL